MDDLDQAPQLYKATNYWANYERRLVPYLESEGLRDFRTPRPTAGSHVLTAFGATDPIPRSSGVRRLDQNRIARNRLTERIPGFRAFASKVADRAEAWMVPGEADEDSRRRLNYEFARQQGIEAGAKPLDEISFSMAGNPEDAFEIDGRWYTRFMLRYYLTYAYAGRFVDYDDVKVYAELGSGMGHQAEILATLHPQATILLFDLPPQLYVCSQYLTTLFGDRVVPYRETRALREPGDLKPAELEPGKIHLLGSWSFEILRDLPVDLFWNGASFQEMEPNVVANYLDVVDGCAEHVFIEAVMDGKERAAKAGQQGVLEPTTLRHYEQGLPSFDRVDLRPTVLPDATVKGGRRKYSDSFWHRRQV